MKSAAFWIGIALIVLALFFVALKKAHAQDEAQIRRDCSVDALRYCKLAILKRERSIIIDCMVKNKDKLQDKCRRHLW